VKLLRRIDEDDFVQYKCDMRKPPRVLPMHMAMAANHWHSQFLSGDKDALGIHGDAQQMMRGIQGYMAHDYVREVPTYDVAFQAGEVRVLKKDNGRDDARPVLLIPSMINKSAILDLMPDKSLFDAFYAAGLCPYILDWGDAIADEGLENFDALFEARLLPAIEALNAQHGRNNQKGVHLVGYCMGGTMAVAAAALSQHVASVATIAAPWDFYHGALAERVKFWTPSLLPSMADKGFMDVDWLQMLFTSLDESMGAEKFARFAAMAVDSDEARLFVAVEDWLNDGVALPAGIAQSVIQDWYFGNTLMKGEWRVCGRDIVAQDIDVPALIVASSKDRLVEYESAHALAESLPDAAVIDPACGHIGMMAGRRAKSDVWMKISDWILGC